MKKSSVFHLLITPQRQYSGLCEIQCKPRAGSFTQNVISLLNRGLITLNNNKQTNTEQNLHILDTEKNQLSVSRQPTNLPAGL